MSEVKRNNNRCAYCYSSYLNLITCEFNCNSKLCIVCCEEYHSKPLCPDFTQCIIEPGHNPKCVLAMMGGLTVQSKHK